MKGSPLVVYLLAVLALAGCSKQPSGPLLQSYSAGEGFWVLIVDEKAIKHPDDLTEIARAKCKSEEVCHAGIWFDAKDAPNLMPISPAQVRAEAFAYGKNVDKEIMWWDCRRYPSQVDKDCIPFPRNP
ncbi:MAG: hypothetical protein U1E56_09430 [Bauldia sp.]